MFSKRDILLGSCLCRGFVGYLPLVPGRISHFVSRSCVRSPLRVAWVYLPRFWVPVGVWADGTGQSLRFSSRAWC